MRRLPIAFTGQQKQHRSLKAANQITQNLYSEILQDDQGKDASRILISVPGKDLVKAIGGTPIRKLHAVSKVLKYYVIAGDAFYEVLNNNNFDRKGTLRTVEGPVYIADNGTHLLIVDGSGTGYVYNIATGVFTDDLNLAAPNFVGGDYVVFAGGYFVVIQLGTNILQSCTAPYGTAPTTWDALDVFSTALSDAGPLKALGVLFGQLWAFGEFATDIFEKNNSSVGFPFSPILGAPISMGISSPEALCLIDNSLIWPAKNKDGEGFVVRASNYSPTRISSNEIEMEISKLSTIVDADAFPYTVEGHSFYVLSFPSGNKTRVYDCTTSEWHSRASLVNGMPGIDKAKGHIFFNGQHLVGDRTVGNILKLSSATYSDNDSPLVRLRRCQHLKEGLNPIEIAALYIDIEVGVGLQGDQQGYDPQMSLRYSPNGGLDWSEELTESMGKIGEGRTQVRFPRLGIGTDWVFEIYVSDPVAVTILGGYVEV